MASSYLAKAIFEQAQRYYEAGDYEMAISNFITLINDYPETDFFFKACLYLGVIHYDLGELAQAKRYLNLCIRRAPKGSEEWVSAVELLGTIYYEEGDNDKAMELFNMLSKYSKRTKKVTAKLVKDDYGKSFGNLKKENTEVKPKLKSLSMVSSNKNVSTNITNITNVVIMTNYVTNYVTNYFTNGVGADLKEIKDKVLEIKEKDENLEELNRLTDIKNRLLKLSEKALMIQELLSNKEVEKNEEVSQ